MLPFTYCFCCQFYQLRCYFILIFTVCCNFCTSVVTFCSTSLTICCTFLAAYCNLFITLLSVTTRSDLICNCTVYLCCFFYSLLFGATFNQMKCVSTLFNIFTFSVLFLFHVQRCSSSLYFS